MLARIVINWWKLKIATDSQLLVESCSRHAWHCEWWVCRKRFGMRSMYFVRFGFSHVNIKRKTFFLLKTALNWTELWRIEVFVRCGSRQNQTRINVHYRTRNEPPTPMCLALNDAFFSPSALILFSVHFVGIVDSWCYCCWFVCAFAAFQNKQSTTQTDWNVKFIFKSS